MGSFWGTASPDQSDGLVRNWHPVHAALLRVSRLPRPDRQVKIELIEHRRPGFP